MSAPMIRGLLQTVLFVNIVSQTTAGIIKPEQIPTYRKKVEAMFHHAYDGYIKYAYPYDELRPLTCDGHDTWGSYSLTLIDALDMLAIVGNNTEFRRVAELISDTMRFDQDINVSVFETNIRVVGGLLSAHLLYKRAGMPLEPGWPCTGPLLRLAEDVATRLLPAFDTATGMPYGTVNLKNGVPKGETTITCTAGVGTFLVEFGALSKLTGNPIFEKVAMRAMRALWAAKSPIGLVGNHIDVATGKWTALDSGIGGGVDSYFEYLVKGSIMYESSELLEMFKEYLVAIEKYLKRDDWYMWAHMNKGTISLPIFTSLDGYWPGIQSLLGDIEKAMKTIHNFHQVWKQFGFLPEYYNIVKSEAHAGREGYPLRPELIEAAVYLYKATKDPYLLQIGVDMIESIEHNTRTKCGYATVKNVNTHMLENRMESFFLAETVKYLYLLFEPDSFIHNTGGHGTIIDTPNGQCVIDTGSYIFNTEAHPIDTAALYCCSAEKKEEDIALQDFHDNLDLLALFNLYDDTDTVKGVKWTKTKKPDTAAGDDFDNTLSDSLLNSLKTMTPSSKGVNQGDHQTLLPTKQETFTVTSVNNVKITISGDKVTVEDKNEDKESESRDIDDDDEEEDDIDDEMASSDSNKKSGETFSPSSGRDASRPDDGENVSSDTSGGAPHTDICDKDGHCEERTKGNDKYSASSNKVPVIPSDEEKIVFSPIPNKPSGGKSSVEFKAIPGKVQSEKAASNQQSSAHTLKAGANTVKDVLELLKSFTKDLLTNSGTSSVKSLHEKLRYYSMYHTHKPELLTCKAQPFYMRYSLMGEMFLDNS